MNLESRRAFFVGTCSVCGTGNIGICVPASGRCVVALCDECDAVWLDSQLKDGPYDLDEPDFLCPGDGSTMRMPPARWANLAEVSAAGWAEAVIAEGNAL